MTWRSAEPSDSDRTEAAADAESISEAFEGFLLFWNLARFLTTRSAREVGKPVWTTREEPVRLDRRREMKRASRSLFDGIVRRRRSWRDGGVNLEGFGVLGRREK